MGRNHNPNWDLPLLSKDGFKPFIFGFLIILMISMILGHAAIRIYQRNKPSGLASAPSGYTELADPKPKQEDAGATSEKRIFGLAHATFKKVHGVFMVLAFIML